MTAATSSIACAHCGDAFPRGQAKCSAVRVASTPSNPTGRVGPDTAPPSTLFCSEKCMVAGVAAQRAMGRCAVCGAYFERGIGQPGGERPGPGRPPAYCGEDCRRQHERTIGKALRDLARDNDPSKLDKVEEALSMARTLQRHWMTGSGPAALAPPSPRARSALRARVERLVELAEQLRDQQRAEQRAEEHRRTVEEHRRRAAHDADEDRRWRKQALDVAD